MIWNGQQPENHQLSGAEFTLIKNERGNACKVFGLDGYGNLVKTQEAQVWDGTFCRCTAADLEEFLLLRNIFDEPSTCLVYGVPKNGADAGTLTTKRERWRFENGLARCREDYVLREGLPGILFFDHDPRNEPGAKRWDWWELDAILCEVLPGFRETRRAWLPSSSAFLYRASDGAELKGIGGWRCYLLINDASAIPRILDYVFQALYARDYGFFEISKGGAALGRTLIDGCTGTPERIDFIANPIIGPGLVRRVPANFPEYLGTKPMLISADVPLAVPMENWRRDNPKYLELKVEAEPRAKAIRKTYVEEVLLPDAKARNPGVHPEELRRKLEEITEGGPLPLETVLYPMGGEPITVRELLEKGKELDELELCDPLEPDYRNGAQVAMFFWNNGSLPQITSFAHGRKTFDLTPALRELMAPKFAASVKLPTTPPLCPQEGRYTGEDAGSEPKPGAKKPGLVVRCGADYEAEPIDWAWKNHFARGKLNLIGGPAGIGKSQLLLNFMGVITTGGTWADGSPCRRGSVLLIQNEDGIEDTVVPRAIAAGVDLTRCFFLEKVCVEEGGEWQERLLRLDSDLDKIRDFLDANPGIDTLIIDPVTAYLGKTDSYKDTEVRAVLTPLAALAEERRIMVIVLAHLNKSAGRAATDRIAGSPAFSQVPRTAHMVVIDPEDADEERRIFQDIKRNICKAPEGLVFTVVDAVARTTKYPDGIETSRVSLEGMQKRINMNEALEGNKGKPDAVSRLEEAKAFLEELLQSGPVLSDIVQAAIKANNLAPATVNRAKKELRIKPRKLPGQYMDWVWELPDTAAKADCTPRFIKTPEALAQRAAPLQ